MNKRIAPEAIKSSRPEGQINNIQTLDPEQKRINSIQGLENLQKLDNFTSEQKKKNAIKGLEELNKK
ncbi:MAG TPA: hypothetical protein PLH29_03630 [bacterium]|nr:hypothetical protein [bacterium]